MIAGSGQPDFWNVMWEPREEGSGQSSILIIIILITRTLAGLDFIVLILTNCFGYFKKIIFLIHCITVLYFVSARRKCSFDRKLIGFMSFMSSAVAAAAQFLRNSCETVFRVKFNSKHDTQKDIVELARIAQDFKNNQRHGIIPEVGEKLSYNKDKRIHFRTSIGAKASKLEPCGEN